MCSDVTMVLAYTRAAFFIDYSLERKASRPAMSMLLVCSHMSSFFSDCSSVYVDVDVCGSCGVIKESSPLRGRVRLTVNTRFREPARRTYRTIDRAGPSKRDFASQSEIIVW